MHNFKPLLRETGKEIHKRLKAGRGGFGKRAVHVVALVHDKRRERLVIREAFIPQRNRQRNGMDLITFQKIRGQVDRAVSCDDNRFSHVFLLLSYNLGS